MLKRIKTSQVRTGMFIQKMEGSWFNHPFWKAGFIVDDPETIRTIQDSKIDAVIIDTSKGVDLHDPGTETASGRGPVFREPVRRIPAPAARAALPVRDTATNRRSLAPLPMAREFGNAQKLLSSSRKIVSGLFFKMRFGQSFKTDVIEPVIEDIFCSIQRNPHTFNGLMRCKQEADFLYRHALATCGLMISLGRQMRLPPDDIRQAGMAGLLMDIGINELPLDLAATGGDYRDFPADQVVPHVKLGYHLLASGGGTPESVMRACLEHHEHLDGGGYPEGLAGERISPLGRMAAICEAYDALVADSLTRRGMDPARALRDLREREGSFDRDMLGHFTNMLGVYPVGSFVRLRSDRIAMVIDEDAMDYARPKVRAFYSLAQGRRVRATDIDLANCYGEDEIAGIADLDEQVFPDPSGLRASLFAAACKP